METPYPIANGFRAIIYFDEETSAFCYEFIS